jgi:hypothetical protein|eukprot:COSAG01_NODE_303_length_19167_cov_10.792454_21_plen_134_part_00
MAPPQTSSANDATSTSHRFTSQLPPHSTIRAVHSPPPASVERRQQCSGDYYSGRGASADLLRRQPACSQYQLLCLAVTPRSAPEGGLVAAAASWPGQQAGSKKAHPKARLSLSLLGAPVNAPVVMICLSLSSE